MEPLKNKLQIAAMAMVAIPVSIFIFIVCAMGSICPVFFFITPVYYLSVYTGSVPPDSSTSLFVGVGFLLALLVRVIFIKVEGGIFGLLGIIWGLLEE